LRLAGGDAADRAQGASPPGRAAALHRHRRPPLPVLHHRPGRRRDRPARAAPPPPRPRRRPDPGIAGARPRPAPLPSARSEQSLVRARAACPRPARLATAARARRRARARQAETAARTAPARRRPHHPLRTPPHPAPTARLAVGDGVTRRLHATTRTRRARLSTPRRPSTHSKTPIPA